jgi:hypothetical protein
VCTFPGDGIAVTARMGNRARVVARFLDGQVLKGYTRNFDPRRRTFELFDPDGSGDDRVIVVRLSDLKTLFFVRDFKGNPAYTERREFEGPFTGRRLSLQFKDGEVMVGTTFGFDAERDGFFFFPADPRSNNEKAYVNAGAVKTITNLPRGVMTA